MWFSEELDEYLKSLGHGNAYQEKIFEDMKNILIESCLSSQENSTHRKNSFEVFGADFMLDEKLNVWLIEINQGPTMSTATKVSDELVGEMLEDMVKVVVDRRARGGRNADTGNFQQVYRQGNADPPPFTGTALSVEGKVCYKPRPKQRTFVKAGIVIFVFIRRLIIYPSVFSPVVIPKISKYPLARVRGIKTLTKMLKMVMTRNKPSSNESIRGTTTESSAWHNRDTSRSGVKTWIRRESKCG